MTKKEFYEQHCKYCGTQRCPADAEAISICGHYEGNIEGIEKVKALINYSELKRVIEERRKQTEKFKELEEYDKTHKAFEKLIEEMELK